MAQVSFTENIQRHVRCPSREVSGSTVRVVLEAVFRENEQARSYCLDERGEVRRHIVVFIDGRPVMDRKDLSDPVTEKSRVYVMQALSGG
ncbi:MAG: MoaD/ThiS family protein [Phycisphaerae bacterium]